MKYWFTSDEHFGHDNIIKYCNRPFKTGDEMDDEIIKRFNERVANDDLTFHLGDFTLKGREVAMNYIRRLNGEHVFIRGSHDYWAEKDNLPQIFEKIFEDVMIVMCHYPMKSWPASFHGSFQLFGHCHGKLKDCSSSQIDVGVDTNNFYPYSLEEILKKLKVDNKIL